MIFLFVSLITLLIIIYYLVFIPVRNIYNFRTIRCYETLPVLGNILEFWKCHEEFNQLFERWGEKYGTEAVTAWGTWWFPIVVLSKAEEVKKVLCRREHVQKGMFYKAFDLTIGTGAFNCPVGIWKKRRPHLEQAFHTKVLQRLPNIFQGASEKLLKALKEDGHTNGNVFDIHPYINLTSIQMLIEGSLGIKVDPLGEREKGFWQKVNLNYNRGTYLAEYRMLRPWFLFFNFIWEHSQYGKELQQVTNWLHGKLFAKMLNKKRISLALSQTHNLNNNLEPESHKSFLDLLLNLQENNPELELTEQDLIHEICSIYIAGHDASGKAMSFALLYLGFYQECQEKVFEEIKETFGNDLERPTTEKELGKMPYLECCLKEALRLMPPVSFITRRVGCDVELDEKRRIPSGAEVAIAVYTVHRDPLVYPNPNVFKPERFLPENSKGRDPYAWIPFSAGPRNCLGPKFAMMEMKIVLCNLLRHYKVESEGSMDKWVLHTNITLKLDGGWNVRLIPRKF